MQIGGGGHRSGLGPGWGSVPPPHPPVPGFAPWALAAAGQADPPPIPFSSRTLLVSPEIPGTAHRFASASDLRLPRYLLLLPTD